MHFRVPSPIFSVMTNSPSATSPGSAAGAHVEPRLLAVRDAATATGLSRSNIHKLIASGELASIKVGRRRLIPVAAIDEYVDRLRAEQAAGL